MTRRELLAKASEAIGEPIPEHVLGYALRRGYVTAPSRRPDGWRKYDSQSVKDLVAYVKNRSRRTLQAV